MTLWLKVRRSGERGRFHSLPAHKYPSVRLQMGTLNASMQTTYQSCATQAKLAKWHFDIVIKSKVNPSGDERRREKWDKTEKKRHIRTCTETELLTGGTRGTPCAGIKQQNPISCHYCSLIRSIWTLASTLHHLPQTFPAPNKPASHQLVPDTFYKRPYWWLLS